MKKSERAGVVAKKMMEATDWCKTMEDLSQTLLAMSYTIGSLVVEFPREDRSQLMVLMVEMMGKGLMATSKELGEPSDLEILTVGRSQEDTP